MKQRSSKDTSKISTPLESQEQIILHNEADKFLSEPIS